MCRNRHKPRRSKQENRTNQLFDGVIERFFWSVATPFNPSEQPCDGPFEETSGSGRTKRVRGAPTQDAGKSWRHCGAARWAEPGIWR